MIETAGYKVVIEAVPPTYKFRTDFSDKLTKLKDSHFDGFIIPHIMDTEEFQRYADRVPFSIFADHLKNLYGKPLILNRVVVYRTPVENERWMQGVKNHGYDQIAIVGAPDRKFEPKTTVEEGIRLSKKHGFQVGAILIPNRENELDRAISRIEAGVDNFQLHGPLEKEKTLTLIRQLRDLSHFPYIYDSLLPITRKEDIERLKNGKYRVSFPEEVERRFMGARDIGEESLNFALESYVEIMDAAKQLGVVDKIGFNIEYIFLSNMELAFELAKEIKTRLSNTTVGVPSAYI